MSLDSLGTPYIPGITALGRVESESDFAELGEGQQDELEDQLNELEDDTEAEGQMNKAAIKARMAEMSLEGDYEPLFEKLPAKTTGSKTMAGELNMSTLKMYSDAQRLAQSSTA